MKKKINGVVVVEGTNDASLITSLFDTEVVTLNGCELQNLAYLKLASNVKTIYVLTDPDEEGIRIRERVNKEIPNCVNVEIDISKCTKGLKNGVAECENSELLQAFSKYTSETCAEINHKPNRIYIADEREHVCSKLGIKNCNNKQFNRKISSLGIKENEIEKMLEDYHGN